MKLDETAVERWVQEVNQVERYIEDVIFLDNKTCILRYNEDRTAFSRFHLLVSKRDNKMSAAYFHKPSLSSDSVLDMLSLSIIHGLSSEEWVLGEARMYFATGNALGLGGESTDEQFFAIRKKLEKMPEMDGLESNRAYAELLIQESGRLEEGEDFETLLRVMNRSLSGGLLSEKE